MNILAIVSNRSEQSANVITARVRKGVYRSTRYLEGDWWFCRPTDLLNSLVVCCLAYKANSLSWQEFAETCLMISL